MSFFLSRRARPRRRFFLGALVLSLATAVAAGEARPPKTLKVVYTEFPPFNMTNAAGYPEGIAIDMVRAVARKAGYRLQLQEMPIRRIYLYLKTGQVDLWLGVADVPALKGQVVEGRTTPVTIHLCVWYLPGQKPVRTLEDLAGHSVILISGYTYGGLLDQLTAPESSIETMTTSSHLAAVQMLQKQRGDYLLDYRKPVEAVLARHGISGLRQSLIHQRDGVFVFSARLPGVKQIRDDFDAAYGQLVAGGKLDPPGR